MTMSAPLVIEFCALCIRVRLFFVGVFFCFAIFAVQGSKYLVSNIDLFAVGKTANV
jgi:hypothetical protein